VRIDRATISLLPRSGTSCVDMAVKYYGRHLKEIALIWLLIAIPICGLVYYLSRWHQCDIRTAGCVLFFATSPYGILLMLVVVPNVFGEPFTLSASRARWHRKGFVLFAKGLLARIAIGAGLVFFVLPGIWLAMRFGFLVERNCLADEGSKLHVSATDKLLRESWGDLVVRAWGIFAFCQLLTGVMFVSFDYMLHLLFGVSTLLDRVGQSLAPMESYASDELFVAAYAEDLRYLIVEDPLVLTLMTAAALFVYPIGRLAWFFCYVDVRVRRDLWDMEIEFLNAAKRLEPSPERCEERPQLTQVQA